MAKSVPRPEDTGVRLGMHAGPVYRHFERIIDRKSFLVSQVNRTAGIELVASLGVTVANEHLVPALAVEPDHDFICVEWFVKEYDRSALYRLTRRGEVGKE